MIKKLIFVFVVSALLVGCGGDGESSSGAGQGAVIAAEASDNSTINLTIDNLEVTDIDANATDQGVINIDNGTAEPSFAIPVEEGVSNIGVQQVDNNPCTNGGTLEDGTQLSQGSLEARCGSDS